MQPRVTAILVAHEGAPFLDRTLAALAAQTRRPDQVVAVDLGSRDGSAALLAASDPTRMVQAPARMTFGQAVDQAVRVIPAPEGDHELLWLLSADNAPAPDALERLLAAIEASPSVAVAGPKTMEWDHPGYIHEMGTTLTTLGAAVPVVDVELDQAQYDEMSDVLGVAAGGMLVRHRLWDELGGFDDALPVIDDALDLCVRARLAGHRVVVVPAARVASAGDAAPGTSFLGKRTPRRRRRRLRRQAQLHRRLAYAPPAAVPFHWLSLVPLAILRALLQMLRKRPTAAPGEIGAAVRVAVAPGRIRASRRRLAATRTAPWSSIASLRQPLAVGRRRRSLAREQYRVEHMGVSDGVEFLATGGGWTVLAALVLSAVMWLPRLTGTALVGGQLLPLGPSAGALWAQVGIGVRGSGAGPVAPSDPFAYVLAVLGSVTAWEPSLAVLGLFVAALPLAALAAWLCAAQLTRNAWLRALAALVWTLSPTLLIALGEGRLPAVLAHLLLPWLALAVLRAPRSWSASAVAGILMAAVGASAPSLVPAVLVLWLVATVRAGRRAGRLVTIPVPLVALVAPLVVYRVMQGQPLALAADPAVPAAFTPADVPGLALGFPTSGLGGWSAFVDGLGAGVPAAVPLVVVAVLAAPLVLGAIAALFLRGSHRAALALGVTVLGFATAVLAARTVVQSTGSDVVAVWPGSGLSLLWLGLAGALVLGFAPLGRRSVAPGVVAAVTLVVLALPLVSAAVAGSTAVRATTDTSLPGLVVAEAATDPAVGTLVLRAADDGSLSADVERGAGRTLEQVSTVDSTIGSLTDTQTRVAELAGNVSSRSGLDATENLQRLGISYVLLETPAGDAEAAVHDRARAALDDDPVFTAVGQTEAGLLWRFVGSDDLVAQVAGPGNLDDPGRVGVLAAQALVFALTLLLAVPTGGLAARSRPLPAYREPVVAPDARPADAEEPRPAHDDRGTPAYIDEPTGEAGEAASFGDIRQAGERRAGDDGEADDVAPAAADDDRARATDDDDRRRTDGQA
ncbi:Glycosyl transferase family 2 [Clavibacter michiganensis]|uniref:Glycosyl transferase family 2 n=1 Tax=Clavibacter michiganensis TaxID=28447 RepID=A0A251YBZ1_9MICO|nr:glycosyltransferase family 2 protein [Clavibacter michiganensis]OUE21578.1 Glycosyl transferase family 2 [Clavibacter michiganensis]